MHHYMQLSSKLLKQNIELLLHVSTVARLIIKPYEMRSLLRLNGNFVIMIRLWICLSVQMPTCFSSNFYYVQINPGSFLHQNLESMLQMYICYVKISFTFKSGVVEMRQGESPNGKSIFTLLNPQTARTKYDRLHSVYFDLVISYYTIWKTFGKLSSVITFNTSTINMCFGALDFQIIT